MPSEVAAERFDSIPLKSLREAPWNPRKTFDAAKLEELAESIRSKGVIEPLVVRPLDGGKTYEIVCGARRFRASKLAKLDAVQCIVRDLSDEDALEFAVIENAQRDNVPPLEDAAGLHALLEMPGHDVAEIAARLGKSEHFVYSRLRLLKLIDPAKKALAEEKLPVGLANLIARLTPKDQATALEHALGAERTGGAPRTVRGLSEWIERNVHLNLQEAPWDLKDADLVLDAGACIACTKRTGTTPGLFPDVQRKDTCTDRECFAAKRTAFVEREIAEEKRKHKIDLVRLSTDRALNGAVKRKRGEPEPLPAWKWVKVPKGKKACNDTRPAIVVEGYGATVGERFNVCVEPKCQVHRPEIDADYRGSSTVGDDSYRKEQATAEKKAKRERIERRAVLDATLNAVVSLDDDDLQVIAAGLVVEMQHETKRDLLKRHGWPIVEREVFGTTSTDVDATILRAIEEGDGVPLARAVLELALSHTLAVGTNGSADPKLLLATAKRHGVNVAEVRKAAHEEKTLAKARKELKDAGKPATKKKGKRARKENVRP